MSIRFVQCKSVLRLCTAPCKKRRIHGSPLVVSSSAPALLAQRPRDFLNIQYLKKITELQECGIIQYNQPLTALISRDVSVLYSVASAIYSDPSANALHSVRVQSCSAAGYPQGRPLQISRYEAAVVTSVRGLTAPRRPYVAADHIWCLPITRPRWPEAAQVSAVYSCVLRRAALQVSAV
jgi:hypothetical protein